MCHGGPAKDGLIVKNGFCVFYYVLTWKEIKTLDRHERSNNGNNVEARHFSFISPSHRQSSIPRLRRPTSWFVPCNIFCLPFRFGWQATTIVLLVEFYQWYLLPRHEVRLISTREF